MPENCWEFKKCGREPNGLKVKELGVCPAAIDKVHAGVLLTGVNEGFLGGRVCWFVAGTLCGGKVQGDFAKKKTTCLSCDFFTKVRKEQSQVGKKFQIEPKPNRL